MAKSKWDKHNIKVTINAPEDEEQLRELADRWNRGIAELIINRIKKFPKEQRRFALKIVKDNLKEKIKRKEETYKTREGIN